MARRSRPLAVFACVLMGFVAAIVAVVRWGQADLGALDIRQQIKTVFVAMIGFILGAQVILNSLFVSILGLGRKERPRVELVAEAGIRG